LTVARRPPVLLLAACLAAIAASSLAAQKAAPDPILFALPGGGIAAFERPAPPAPINPVAAPIAAALSAAMVTSEPAPVLAPSAPQVPQVLVAVQIPSPPILRFNSRDSHRPNTPYSELIYKAARRHAVNPQVVAAVIEAESDFQPKAKSHAGACGLMQLLPETARRFGLLRKRDIFNPAKNIEAGVRYLGWLTERFGGDLARVVAAYNAGEGAVDRFGGVPPFQETQSYLRRIYGTLGLTSLLSAIVPPMPAISAMPTPEAVFPIASGPVANLVESGH
jgi:soluble lytic murein transglycosylase-like protein